MPTGLWSVNPGGKSDELRLGLSPGDTLRWIAQEMEDAPDHTHVWGWGDDVFETIPRDQPYVITELREMARKLDGQGDN